MLFVGCRILLGGPVLLRKVIFEAMSVIFTFLYDGRILPTKKRAATTPACDEAKIAINAYPSGSADGVCTAHNCSKPYSSIVNS